MSRRGQQEARADERKRRRIEKEYLDPIVNAAYFGLSNFRGFDESKFLEECSIAFGKAKALWNAKKAAEQEAMAAAVPVAEKDEAEEEEEEENSSAKALRDLAPKKEGSEQGLTRSEPA